MLTITAQLDQLLYSKVLIKSGEDFLIVLWLLGLKRCLLAVFRLSLLIELILFKNLSLLITKLEEIVILLLLLNYLEMLVESIWKNMEQTISTLLKLQKRIIDIV